jgi:hypothetical protein
MAQALISGMFSKRGVTQKFEAGQALIAALFARRQIDQTDKI